MGSLLCPDASLGRSVSFSVIHFLIEREKIEFLSRPRKEGGLLSVEPRMLVPSFLHAEVGDWVCTCGDDGWDGLLNSLPSLPYLPTPHRP